MAGVLSKQRFPEFQLSEIQELQNNATNKNTAASTGFWVNVFKSWARQRGFPEAIESYEAIELDGVLQKCYAEVRNQNGDEYEPDSLRVMIAALDRHLKHHGYQTSIIRDREFASSKQVLEGKARRLRQEGRGKRNNKARGLTEQEEEELWERGKLGNTTPESLINTMWWILTQYFGLRGRQEHHGMKVDDFTLGKDDTGCDYVEFAEGLTKTRNGGLSKKCRDFTPKMFATGTQRCPVSLFKEYLSRRPTSLQTSGPFYLSVNYKPKDDVWYKAQPMGTNRINEMMKRIIVATSLEQNPKKLTNHSARKTVVSKLKKHNVERSSVVKVTGHRNLQSLDDYDEGDEEEQRDLSSKISRRNNMQPGPSSALYGQTSSLASSTNNNVVEIDGFHQANHMNAFTTLRQESQHQMLNSNVFNNCQVTFAVGSTMDTRGQTPVINVPNKDEDIRPRKRRCGYMIDSDSD